MARNHQLGESKVGCIFGVIVLVIAIFVAVKVIPVRVSVAALQDFIEETAQRAGSLSEQPNNPVTQQVAAKIAQKAKEENLPVPKESIKVGMGSGRINVEVKYTVTIDLLVYQYEWAVEHKVERLVF